MTSSLSRPLSASLHAALGAAACLFLATLPAAASQAATFGPQKASLTVEVLAPALRAAMVDAEADERLDVYLVMADQVPGVELERRAGLALKAIADNEEDGDPAKKLSGSAHARMRRRLVADQLKAHAQTTQAAARAVIAAAETAGHAELINVLWMGNAILLRAEPSVLDRLAGVPGVHRIRLLPDTPAERAQDVQVATAPPVSPPPTKAPTLFSPAAAAAGNAPYPFSDDFESGALQPHWSVATTGGGYVNVTDLEGPFGDYHVLMATNTNSVDSTASLTVELDLAGQTDVGILFRHKEFGDEDHPEDGVFVSIDGITWHEVLSLQGLGREYVWQWVTLDPLLAGFGITFTSSFLVRFQWRDNFNIPSDGFAFDDIQIAPGIGIKPPPDIEPHLIALQAPMLWDRGYQGSGVLIGNIDSGTNWQHPDLQQRVWTNPGEIGGNGLDDDGNGFIDDMHGWDFEFNGANVISSDPHGTHTAGLMVGDGTSGRITGMAPAASLAICEVSNEGHYWQAQQYLLDIGVDVISSSYSYKWPDSPDYHMFRQLCDVELAAGIIHANSIGNQGVLLATHPIPFNISTPGNCPSPFAHPDAAGGGRSSVMACGGIQLPDDIHYNAGGRGPVSWEDITLYDASYPHTQLPSYWDYPVGGFGGGQVGLIKPDVVTYTNTVMTTNLNTGYTLFSGTSAAAPQLGGAMALLRDVQPNALPRHIAGALELSAFDLGDPGKDNFFGAGKVRVFKAARRLQVLARFSTPIASPGQPFDLEFFGAPNDIVYGFYQASLMTGTGALNLPQPLFFLGVQFLDAQGEATWNLAVPNDASLIGLTVWFQGASLPLDGTWGPQPFFSVPDSLTVVP